LAVAPHNRPVRLSGRRAQGLFAVKKAENEVNSQRTSAMVRMTHWIGMLLLACTSSGCGHFFDYVDSTVHEMKCKHRAKSAWMDARDLYCGVSYPFNFGEGFRAGFKSVCLGNDTGCAPPMPPRRYWSSCYLNCEGQAKAMAWYDGYGHGVVAADCSGSASHCQVVTGSGGSSEYGSALKGYKPPVQSPYANPNGPEYDGVGGGEPTPIEPLLAPPPEQPLPAPAPSEEAPVPYAPRGDGDFVPPAPGANTSPLEVRGNRGLPHLPAAEAYRVPVF